MVVPGRHLEYRMHGIVLEGKMGTSQIQLLTGDVRPDLGPL